ncbi:MAG TPA: TetR/AcrR family transcriptional regulator [Aldersonia sp.]
MLHGNIVFLSRTELFRYGSEFHEMIVDCAHNAYLSDAVKRVNRMRRLIEYNHQADRSRLVTQATEHLHLLDLLESGRNDEASRFLYQHLDTVRETKTAIPSPQSGCDDHGHRPADSRPRQTPTLTGRVDAKSYAATTVLDRAGAPDPMTDAAAFVRRRDPDRKEKILAAAAELVAGRGFHSVSMADIGARVGISGAAVYRHFDNKNTLLLALFDRSLDGLLSEESAIVTGRDDVPGALRALIERQVDFVVDEREFARVYYREVEHLSPDDQVRLRRKQRQYVEEWVHLVRELDDSLDESAARVLVHATIGTIQSALVHNVGMPDDRLKAMLLRAAYAVIGLPVVDAR